MKKILLLMLSIALFSCEIPQEEINETGSWTPQIIDVGGGATYTINNLQSAQFHYDGDIVFFEAVMNDIETTGTATGALMIAGLPYILSSETAVNVFFFANGSVDYYYIGGRLTGIGNSPVIFFYHKDEFTPDYEGVFYNDLNGADLRISGFYFTQ